MHVCLYMYAYNNLCVNFLTKLLSGRYENKLGAIQAFFVLVYSP